MQCDGYSCSERYGRYTPVHRRPHWSCLSSQEGDVRDTANYRQIAVGDLLSRLYASILVQRLVHFTEQLALRSTQAGYMPEHSTIHQAFVQQHVIDKHKCLKTSLYLGFVDQKSAYDRVHLIEDLLRRLGLQGKMLGAVQSLVDCVAVMVSSAGDAQPACCCAGLDLQR